MCLITGDYMAHHQMAWCSCVSLANGFIISKFQMIWLQKSSDGDKLKWPRSSKQWWGTKVHGDECMMTGSASKAPLKCLTNDHTVVGSLVPRGLCAWTAPSPLVLSADWLQLLLNKLGYQACQYSFFFFNFFLFFVLTTNLLSHFSRVHATG